MRNLDPECSTSVRPYANTNSIFTEPFPSVFISVICCSCKLFSCFVNTTETCSRSQWVTAGEGGVLQLWSSIYPQASATASALVQVSLPALHHDSRRDSLNLPFNKNSSLRPRFPPGLPWHPPHARCSCDLRALCTTWWEEVTANGEHGTRGWFLTSEDYFCTFTLYFTEMSLISSSDVSET